MSDLDYLSRRIGYDTYNDYLKSEHWTVFSDGMRKSNCYCCKKQKPNLQVHHLTYERLGQELPPDVVTVCGQCHIAIHALSKSGTPLIKAHIAHRNKLHAKRKPKKKIKQWVQWFDLRNKSKHETLDQLKCFLIAKGLSDGRAATEKAYKFGFAKLIEGKERWNLRKYIKMMKSDRQLQNWLSRGKRVCQNMYQRALLDGPQSR